MIVDPLVRHDPADKQDVDQAVAENLLECRPARCAGDAPGIDGDGQHAGRREPQLLELTAIELRVAERQIDVPDERRQLLASDGRQAEESRRVRGKERRRRDVVILQHARAVEARERARHRRGQREVKDGDIAARGLGVGKRPDVGSQVVVDRQREDIGRMPLAAQHPAHPARAVPDGVTAMGRGHPLVDDHRSDLGTGGVDPGIRDRGSGFWALPSADRPGSMCPRSPIPDPRSPRRAEPAAPGTAPA